MSNKKQQREERQELEAIAAMMRQHEIEDKESYDELLKFANEYAKRNKR